MGVAQRMYARALFEAANEQGRRLQDVNEALTDFLDAATNEVPELGALLESPELDRQAKAEVARAVLEGADDLVRNLVLLVIEKGRAAELASIGAEFNALMNESLGWLKIELTTATELSPQEAGALTERIGRETGATTVEAQQVVDPSLLGGFVLQAGSLRVDASVRGRLERLRHELTTVH